MKIYNLLLLTMVLSGNSEARPLSTDLDSGSRRAVQEAKMTPFGLQGDLEQNNDDLREAQQMQNQYQNGTYQNQIQQQYGLGIGMGAQGIRPNAQMGDTSNLSSSDRMRLNSMPTMPMMGNAPVQINNTNYGREKNCVVQVGNVINNNSVKGVRQQNVTVVEGNIVNVCD
jgi:hypothetical protein